MKPSHQKTDTMAPKPVHPKAIRHHGLFGPTFLKQHNIIDKKWSVEDIIEEYHGLANLLEKRVVFMKLEHKAYRRKLYKSARNLRTQCRNGRTQLQKILNGNNVRAIRNYLLNCKEMQRLYQKMTVNQVSENINQRTFVMRKERDRLEYRLNQLKRDYELKLLERADLENRLKYQNAYILEEDTKMNKFLENVKKSKIRLKAIKTIYSTYKKVIEVLQYDEIFYEPILRGLSLDIDDQANFIKHILYLGTPAITEFKELSEEYRILQAKSRKSTQQKINTIDSYKQNSSKPLRFKSKAAELVVNISKHYARETKSMLTLKNELEDIKSTIKQIKIATLCSKANEIFPRFKSKIESNFKLKKENTLGQIQHDFGTFKGKLAEEKQNILMHNYSEEEEKRLFRIKLLEEQIKEQDVIEEKTLAYLKYRADVFVILRYSLWNLIDILRNVGRPEKIQRIKYPNSYLKLPLLKFEMQTMRACPPDAFEADTKMLLISVQKKLRTLMKAFTQLIDLEPGVKPSKTIKELWEDYHGKFLSSQDTEKQLEEIVPLSQEEDVLEESKILQYVPSRKHIKLQSARIVEELSKRDD